MNAKKKTCATGNRSTIDGEDAKDQDEARVTGKKTVTIIFLGVHIADVTNYVQRD